MKFTVTDKLLLAIAERLLRSGSRIAGVGSRIDAAIRTKRSIPVGTAVTLTCTECGFHATSPDHKGVWYVARYNVDADDYLLSRDREDRSHTRTYARENVLALVMS